MDNNDRAIAADKALATFTRLTGMQGEDIRTRMVDLLADLYHLADRENIDMAGALDSARWHHESEVKDPG